MYQAGLVLEGGGMKGVYTAGVLDLFLDKELEFSSVYGVSAGACNMCSYVAKQRGRALDVNIDYLDSKRYCSVESMILSGDLFNVNTCYNLIPNYLNPIDKETYAAYEGKAYSVVTNLLTGRPEYLRVKDAVKDIDKVRASSSLPLVSRTVTINGKPYLDGGLSDSIPIQKSIRDGNRKNVVVMTKEIGYRRKPIDSGQLALIKVRYARYPKVAEIMAERHIMYNDCLDYIERLEKSGQVFVSRPQHPNDVRRIERDKVRMKALYDQGYQEAEALYEDLMNYLNS